MSFFSSTSKTSKASLRPKYTIRPNSIVEVLCHRKRHETEEYLVRWRTKPVFPCPPRAIASWHALPELRNALHHVQAYIEKNSLSGKGNKAPITTAASRKRKLHEDDAPLSRGALGTNSNGLLTPEDSVLDLSTPEPEQSDDPLIYNGYFQYKAGYIIAKKDVTEAATINTRNLPTQQMQEQAARTPVNQAEAAIRNAFDDKLRKVRAVRLENNYDSTTPNLNFDFIQEYVLREGVSEQDPDIFPGCQKCRPNMGGNCGCEYTTKCDCLEFAAVEEDTLARKNPELYAVYKAAIVGAQEESKAAGEVYLGRDGFNTVGLPKRFPYSKPSGTGRPQTMADFYRESRHPIYECNINCKCGPGCKSRLVQKGRRVPLVIYKTGLHKGWGVYCEEELIEGEFIDTYLGEVITNEETERRENSQEASKDKDSYLYSLDKFVGDRDPLNNDLPLEQEDCYVVDGQHMGNVTRFINHSCEPNVRQYTVSYNKHDLKLYNLAFFAYENIPAGTELVFDYLDKDEVELEEAIRRREARRRDPAYADKSRCFCGAEKCRGYLWDKDDVREDLGSSQRTT